MGNWINVLFSTWNLQISLIIWQTCVETKNTCQKKPKKPKKHTHTHAKMALRGYIPHTQNINTVRASPSQNFFTLE
jgi:hypothetical protein